MSQNPYVPGWTGPADDSGDTAFGDVGAVTWNNGWGPEDLAGGPAPVATPVSAPVATPPLRPRR